MLVIAVDLGTYSIKFLASKIERGKVVHEFWRESIIDMDEIDVTDEHSLMDLKMKMTSEFLATIEDEYKLIMLAPGGMFTTRFISVPVKNKNKAKMMVPFKMEEDLPFTLSEAHYGMTMTAFKAHTDAMVSICRQEDFKPVFNKLERYKITPNLLTSTTSILAYYVNKKFESISDAFCIIDIGHTTTKAFFFYNKKLVSTHISFVAGKVINEAISDSYGISDDEAAIYKHQNCFVLTDDQYAQVDESQRKFAKLMEKTLSPLLHEFKRWELGFRVSHGLQLSEVYLTGGSSNIRNLSNFWSEHVGIRTEPFDSFNHVETKNIDSEDKQRRKFNLANIMCIAYPNKSSLINLLTGRFSLQGTVKLPLQSYSYLATRALAMTLLIFMALSAERFFINRNIQHADEKVKAIVKNPLLKFTNRQKRLALTNPHEIFNKLKRNRNFIAQEVSSLQSAVGINAVAPLMSLRDLLVGSNVTIRQFSGNSTGSFTAVLESESVEALENMKDTISNAGYGDLFLGLHKERKTLEVNASLKL